MFLRIRNFAPRPAYNVIARKSVQFFAIQGDKNLITSDFAFLILITNIDEKKLDGI